MSNEKTIAPIGFGWILAAFGVADLVALLVCSILLVVVIINIH